MAQGSAADTMARFAAFFIKAVIAIPSADADALVAAAGLAAGARPSGVEDPHYAAAVRAIAPAAYCAVFDKLAELSETDGHMELCEFLLTSTVHDPEALSIQRDALHVHGSFGFTGSTLYATATPELRALATACAASDGARGVPQRCVMLRTDVGPDVRTRAAARARARVTTVTVKVCFLLSGHVGDARCADSVPASGPVHLRDPHPPDCRTRGRHHL